MENLHYCESYTTGSMRMLIHPSPLAQLVANLNSFSPCFWVRYHLCNMGTNEFVPPYNMDHRVCDHCLLCFFGLNAQKGEQLPHHFNIWSSIAAWPCHANDGSRTLQIDRMMKLAHCSLRRSSSHQFMDPSSQHITVLSTEPHTGWKVKEVKNRKEKEVGRGRGERSGV